MSFYEDLDFAKKLEAIREFAYQFKNTYPHENKHFEKVSAQDKFGLKWKSSNFIRDIIITMGGSHNPWGMIYRNALIHDRGDNIVIFDRYGLPNDAIFGCEIPNFSETPEEIHFQNSLLYTEFQNRMLVCSWYLGLNDNKYPDMLTVEFALEALDFITDIIEEYKEDELQRRSRIHQERI